MEEEIRIGTPNIMHPARYLKNKVALSKYEKGFISAEELCSVLEKKDPATLELADAKFINELKACVDVVEHHAYSALGNSFISTIKSNKDNFEEGDFKQIEPVIEKWTPAIETGSFYQGEYNSFLSEIRKTPKFFEEILQTIEETLNKEEHETRLENIKRRISASLNRIKKAKEIMLSTNFSFMSPYDFEEFIARLFDTQGYKTEVTKKTGDYGVDVIAEKGLEKIAIQCKKYQEGNSVGNQTVQMLLGAMQLKNLKANKGIIITTSEFTKQAYKQAESNNVELWNKSILHQKVRECLLCETGPGLHRA